MADLYLLTTVNSNFKATTKNQNYIGSQFFTSRNRLLLDLDSLKELYRYLILTVESFPTRNCPSLILDVYLLFLKHFLSKPRRLFLPEDFFFFRFSQFSLIKCFLDSSCSLGIILLYISNN